MKTLQQPIFWRMKLKIALLTVATFIALC